MCVAENLIIGPDGQLRLAPWSRPRNVVDVVASSSGDTTKLLETKTLPGLLLIDRKVSWTNDAPVEHDIRVLITRRWRRWVTSNPNAVQFRDRWSSAITPKGDDPIEPAEPVTSGILNGQVGSAEDIGTNSVAEPNPGKYFHWWGTNTTEEWLGPVAPGDKIAVWYRQYVWTPEPWSDNANKNAPDHQAEAGWARIQLQAFPYQGKRVIG
ncbi:hypothetical protein I5G61_gp38 [Mycobacterium phage Quesadilla]|uniref:DUF7172 domain-containing protein n=1 Tax=Mycobacterium phage Quesadilla TaxID=2664226 RepID=A0A5Q2W9V4_9CAUD|nr:hypothetical protein I5G61_gp38 [Mycobacterium phage Quesadilla]QGH75286.1 hypothetical protein SEA_QUESADILLA_38 [Mycobacterium phage Quesadilla]